MKLGIIIICHNNEQDIDKEFYINQSDKVKEIEICLVNNNSKDSTYEIIRTIKEYCENVSVVDVKKYKSDLSAVKAGARYMFNQFDLKHIGYVTNINNYEMNSLIETISENQDAILNFNLRVQKKKETRQTLLRSLFSIPEYLKKLKISFLVNSIDNKQITNL